jgi:hypothetical protein
MAPSQRLNGRKRLFTRKARPTACRPARPSLQIESLEDRLVPTLDASTLFNQLGSQFGAVSSGLGSILDRASTPLPIINQPLSSISNDVQQAIAGIDNAFVQLAQVLLNNPALQKIQNALNSAATDAAAQAIRDALGSVAENVKVSNLDPAAGNVTVSMDVVKGVGLLNKRFDFGLGLPSIPFHIQSTGDISLQAAARYDNLTFGFSGGTFFLNTDQPDELKLTLDAGLALGRSSMTGEIGFLRITATPSNSFGLHGQLVADVTGTGANLQVVTDSAHFVGLTANADLHLLASFVPPAGIVVPGMNADEIAMSLPKIQTDFHLGWDLSGADPRSGLAGLGSAPSVALNNVQVGLGSFLGSALAPVVSAVQRATAPLQPILDFLDAAIPGLSDLGAGKVSLLTLAQAANDLGAVPLEFQPIVTLAVDLTNLLTLIDNTKIDPNNDLWINVGSYDLSANQDVRGLAKAGSIADLLNNPLGNLSDLKFVAAAAQKLHDQVDAKLSDNDPVQHALKQRLDAMFQQLDALANGAHLSFPFFEDPLKGAVQILLGRDADLVSLDANFTVHTGDRELAKFPLYGPISARLSGNLDLTAHFQAGYDTRGLREFLAGGNAAKLVDGLYLDSSRDLIDIGASITASADYAFLPTLGPYFIPPSPIPVYVTASVGIGGTLSGYFDTRLHDPHRGQPGWDGKLRLFGEKIHELFDAHGSLSAELDFHVDAYADGLVKLDTLYSKTLASTVLFDSNRIDPTNPFDPPSPGTFGGNPRRDEVVDMSKTPWGNDGEPDKIEVLQNKDKYEVWINDQLAYTYNVTDTKSLTIVGSNDPDNIILHDLGVPVSVDGKDAVAHTQVPYLYPGLNKNTLTIDNRAVTVPYADTYTVTDSAITRSSRFTSSSDIFFMSQVSYTNIEDVQLILAPTFNTVAVNRLPSAPVTIVTSSTPTTNFFPWVPHQLYDSHNTITLTSDVLAKDRQLNIVGNSADDHLVLQDQTGSNAAYAFTQDSITLYYLNPLIVRPNFQGTIHFTGLENLDVVGINVIDPTTARFGGLVGRTYRIESWTPQTALNISGADGGDTFLIGGGGQIDPVSGDEIYNRMRISLNGGGGSNSLILNDSLNNDRAYQDPNGNIIQAWSTHPYYSITDQYVARDNVVNGNSFNRVHLVVNYKNINDLQIWGGGSNDTFDVVSTPAGFTTTLKGNAGDDVALLGATNSVFIDGLLDPIKGPVVFDGGLGNNQLIIIDKEGIRNAAYTITDKSVQVGGFQVTYSGVTSVELTTGQGLNPVSITSTADGAPVTVHTGKADASIVIGPFGLVFSPTPDMTKIRSTVTVDGGGGSVSLTVGDVELNVGQTYNITDTAVRRSGGPEIHYSGITTLNVIGTRAADVFEIDSTAAGVKTAITGGFGDNVYNFGRSSHTLDGLQGRVSIQGSILNNSETIGFFDDQASSAQNYTVKTTGTFLGGRFLGGGTGELDRSGSAAITYIMPKGSAALFTGQGADTINVQSVGQTISLVVYAGAGDTVVLGSNPSGQGGDVQRIVGSVSILSSGGVASITVDDSADMTARSVKLSYSQDDAHEYATLEGLAPAKLTFGVGPETPIYLYGGPGTARPSTAGPANDIQVFFNGELIP